MSENDATGWIWNDRVAAELQARLQSWMACNIVGDMETLRTLIHEDFLYVSAFGRRYDKAGYVALAGSLRPGARYVIHRTSARVRGGIAQLDGEYYTSSVTDDGDDLTAHTRFTATWVADAAGEWLCLTQQGTSYDA